jgi:hypothetical protein
MDRGDDAQKGIEKYQLSIIEKIQQGGNAPAVRRMLMHSKTV